MILVTGSTGMTGSELIRRLSAAGVPVRALARSMAKASALSALPNVEIEEGDMAHPKTLSAALQDVERAMLISSSAPDMLEVRSNGIEAASKRPVKYVVKLSVLIPSMASTIPHARSHLAIVT